MEEKDRIINVPVEDILPNRFQPRIAFNEKELNELSNSIVKYGVIQPIVLRKIGNKYEIIAGERRYKATVLAGLKTIPAIINNTDDNTSAEIALLENLQRKNLTVIEEAQSFKKLLDRGFTQEEIATKLGISQSSIANKLRLLNLPKKVQDALLYNKIAERHARSLLSLNNADLQNQMLDRIINERLTVKQTEEEIAHILNKKAVEDDIPDNIRKYINPNSNPNNNISNKDFINSVPEVLSIDDEEEKKEEKPKEHDNVFQIQFKDNIRKIEEEIRNHDNNYYDNIINNNLKNNNIKVENNSNKEEEKPTTNKNNNISNIVTKVREFVKDFDSNSIKTKEENLPDKYRIVIEIDKNN